MKTFNYLLCLILLASCTKPTGTAELSIIPMPESVVTFPGEFVLKQNTRIVATGEAAGTAGYLRTLILKSTGYDLEVTGAGKGNAIILKLDTLVQNPEGYILKSGKKAVTITASTPAGLFYGIQTLRQMFPAGFESDTVIPEMKWSVPAAEIHDQPRFAWRGMMLDCVRHFFPVSHVKHIIDQLAARKMNHFHWHLVDDQGWRVEIKQYPELTTTSAWRVDREHLHWNERPAQEPGETATYGGFYTQEEIRDIVAYAASQHIEVIPEIEMPAHVTCVFASYPQFSCSGEKVTVPPGSVWPITNIYCAGNDGTFEFLENVLSEVITLFPSGYIHVGGDEATKTNWKKCKKCQARIKEEGLKDENELQSYFIKRIEKYLNSQGRNLIGWDEILEGGLAPEATVMSWRGFQGGIEAARSGHDVVMSPTDYCYFDYYQGPKESEPLAIGGFLPVSKVYRFNLIPSELTADEAKHILGGQANLWTEYIPTPEHSEYMLFPRLEAMTEALWTKEENKNYEDFLTRLQKQFERYESAGIHYSRNIY